TNSSSVPEAVNTHGNSRSSNTRRRRPKFPLGSPPAFAPVGSESAASFVARFGSTKQIRTPLGEIGLVSRTDRIVGALAVSVLLIVVALAGSALIQPGATHVTVNPVPVRTEDSNNFDQLVIVWFENKNQNEVYGPATYMTQLADQYGFAQHWASITNPSQPNYIAYIGASTFGVTGDGNHPNLNHPTIVDLIENTGHTWKAFGEDASGTGCGLNPPRGEDHFPFLSYTTITGSPSRCANLLPGSGNEVINAFNAGTNFIWLTPNDCNNMHSCSVATGDNYIHGWVPQLLTAMNGKKALLILTFDEAYTNPPYIYHAFIGPAAKLAYKSTVEYTHYSLARMIEDVWGGGNLGQNDVSANSPVEFFLPGGPDFGLVANPTSVSFAAGGSATSTISLTASGGFTGTVGLTASSSPAGVTTTCVPSSISGSQTSTCTFGAANAGSYSVTITGTSGTLVHTAAVSVTVTAAGPVARFTFAPAYPQVNDTVTFDASSSTDSDPTATLQARWDWAGDGTWDTPYSSVLTAQHAFAAAGTTQVMVWIESTNLYVVVENNRIANLAGTNQWEAFQVGHWPAILATQHVTFRHNSVENAQHAYGFGIREGSTDIHIEANYVGLDS